MVTPTREAGAEIWFAGPMNPCAFRANEAGGLWLPDWTLSGSELVPEYGKAVRGQLGEPCEGTHSIALNGRGEELPVVPTANATSGASFDGKALFVYGTLMAGEGLHEHLHACGDPGDAVVATTRGRLLDFDAWPGLLPDPSANERVFGELYHPSDARSLLRVLDEVEDFFGYGDMRCMFRRVVLEVSAHNRSLIAWGYRVVAETAQVIPGGNWRER